MSHVGLSDTILTTLHISGRSASAVANGTAVDMQGWEGARFTISLGTFGTNSTFDALVQTAPDSGFNTVTNVSGAALVQIPATNANCVAIIDVFQPTSRYIRLQANPAVNASIYSVTVDQYSRNGILPPTQSAQQVVKIAQN